MSRHGTRQRYQAGCRCVPCRASNATYRADRARAAGAGRSDALVFTAPLRAHLLTLARAGVGTRQVARVSGIPRSRICAIRAGHVRWVRPSTAALVLAVHADDKAPRVLVSARGTWQLVDRLGVEGFTRAEIARRLGLCSPGLQWGAHRIQLHTAVRLRRFYARAMGE